MDKEKIRKTLLELGFKANSDKDRYFFREVDAQDYPGSLEHLDAYTELTVDIDKGYFSLIDFLERWEFIRPGSSAKNIISHREMKYRVAFETEKSLWWLIKWYGTSEQRRMVGQLQKQEKPRRCFLMKWLTPKKSSD